MIEIVQSTNYPWVSYAVGDTAKLKAKIGLVAPKLLIDGEIRDVYFSTAKSANIQAIINQIEE